MPQGSRRAQIAAIVLIVIAGVAAGHVAAAPGGCTDPLPLDPQRLLKDMGWQTFRGAQQFGPVCSLQWNATSGVSVTLLMYGPTALRSQGITGASARAAADRYRGESPKGVEPVPGARDVYTVFDPKTVNRRVFTSFRGGVYMLNITGETIPLAALVKALLRT